jgi:hypothetical protein
MIFETPYAPELQNVLVRGCDESSSACVGIRIRLACLGVLLLLA